MALRLCLHTRRDKFTSDVTKEGAMLAKIHDTFSSGNRGATCSEKVNISVFRVYNPIKSLESTTSIWFNWLKMDTIDGCWLMAPELAQGNLDPNHGSVTRTSIKKSIRLARK